MEETDKFFFGREYDLNAKKALPESPVFYEPSDLVTHSVIVGMTGSGKTGMGMILLEEAALKGIPAILIDPKGDLTNELLHFPSMMPEDFTPWVDASEAARAGKTAEQAGAEASQLWRTGLTDWGITKQNVVNLSERVEYAVYTPGSNAGIPVSILSSLKCPQLDWTENAELLTETISSTVTALLGLVDFRDVDPISSPAHILLANIFQNAWGQGKDLDLESLITQIQVPPFEKLGVLPVNKFFPEKDRIALAVRINNLLAAPDFAQWMQSQPLDVQSFLYTKEGKPRHSVFYLAHLSDEKRMFFVTLLYTAVQAWMRRQQGTQALRAIVYFDEIAGYLPPVANPPSKPIILRLLKQARAFGLGLVLSTQNPIDLDYKALSNTGTWIIGKLQTEQDKARLLDGLTQLTGGFDGKYFDNTISALGKRVFVLHNIHAKHPVVFTTRWAMNYLPGPVPMNKLDALNKFVGADKYDVLPATAGTAEENPASAAKNADAKSSLEPAVSSKVDVFYLPITLSPSQALMAAKRKEDLTAEAKIHYVPVLLAQATVYLANRTYGLNSQQKVTVILPRLDGRGLVQWQNYQARAVDSSSFETRAKPASTFGELPYPMNDEVAMQSLNKDFVDWIYRNYSLTLFTNPATKLYSTPGESQLEFEARVARVGASPVGTDIAKVQTKYAKKRESLKTKLMKEQMELEKDRTTLNQRRLEQAGSWVATIGKAIFGSKKSGGLLKGVTGSGVNSSMTKNRMASTAKANVEESERMIDLYQQQLAALDQQEAAEISAIQFNPAKSVTSIQEVHVKPAKNDIVLELFGVAWIPNYSFNENGTEISAPAFEI